MDFENAPSLGYYPSIVTTLDVTAIKQQRVLEHHFVANHLAEGCKVLLGQSYFSGKTGAESTHRPVAAPYQAILSECGHEHVEVTLVGGEGGRRRPPLIAVANQG